MIEPRLPYNYAILDANNRCVGCKTYSYQVPLANYIPVPYTTDDYLDKYYNPTDGLWYHDGAYQNIWEECPSHNV
jgi:hypothetical protein